MTTIRQMLEARRNEADRRLREIEKKLNSPQTSQAILTLLRAGVDDARAQAVEAQRLLDDSPADEAPADG